MALQLLELQKAVTINAVKGVSWFGRNCNKLIFLQRASGFVLVARSVYRFLPVIIEKQVVNYHEELLIPFHMPLILFPSWRFIGIGINFFRFLRK